jgi:hypothetical protein
VLDDLFRRQQLELGGQPGRGALLLDDLDDLVIEGIVMVAQDDGRPAHQVVDVLVAVDVPELVALGLVHGYREGVARRQIVLDSARDIRLEVLVQLERLRPRLVKLLLDLLEGVLGDGMQLVVHAPRSPLHDLFVFHVSPLYVVKGRQWRFVRDNFIKNAGRFALSSLSSGPSGYHRRRQT